MPCLGTNASESSFYFKSLRAERIPDVAKLFRSHSGTSKVSALLIAPSQPRS